MAVAAQAALIQVDFGATGGDVNNGTTTEGGTTWNGVEPGVSGANLTTSFLASNLLDSTNAVTTVDLTLDWSSQSGLDFSRAWDLTAGADRDGDYLAIRGDNVGVFNTATFSDLTIGALYDVTVWTQAPTDFSANGGITVQVLVGADAVGNNAVSYTFTDVAADASGEIAIDWGHITTSRGANQWASVTAMSIVPEHGTYALLAGLTGLVFVMVRRRR